MKRPLGVSVVLLRSLAQSVGRLGGAPDAFLRALGVDEGTSIDAYVPASQVMGALEGLSGRSGASVALSLARASPVGSLGFFDYLFVASSNLREALARCVRFYGLLTQLVSLSVEEDDNGCARLFHRINPSAPRVPALTEFASAYFVSRARDAVGDRLGLQTIRFTHDVVDPQPYEAFFGLHVAFGGAVDEMRFDASALDVPFPSADPTTVAFLDAHAARMNARLGSVDSFRDRARCNRGRPSRQDLRRGEPCSFPARLDTYPATRAQHAGHLPSGARRRSAP